MKLLLTKELGRLAKWLRILGIDALYFKDENVGSLIILALRDNRIILTRNHRLPCTLGIKKVIIRAERIKEQISETLKALNIRPDSNIMFSRCTICNEELTGVAKEQIRERVPEYVFKTQDSFMICPSCKRIYWMGTHWGNVNEVLKAININSEL